MADGIGGALQGKLGPAPLWMWLVGGGIGLYLVTKSGFLSSVTGSGKSTTGTATSATALQTAQQQALAAGANPSAGAALQQSIGLLSQLQGFNSQAYQNALQQVSQTQGVAGSLATTTPTSCIRQSRAQAQPGAPGGASDVTSPGVVMHSGPDTASPTIGYAPFNSCNWRVLATSMGPGGIQDPGNNIGWSQISNGLQTGWIDSSSLVASPAKATGGGRPRSSALFHAGHKALKQSVRMPHYAVGGPRDLRDVALQTGIHPARLMAANPHLRQQGYVASPGQHVRIA
jgi:hypothetical protein